MNKSVGFISLGCAKNRIDTEEMLGFLFQQGYRLEENLHKTDCIIINTCGFIKDAQQESINTILKIAAEHKRSAVKIVVTGCLVEVFGTKMLHIVPQIDGMIGVHSYHKLGHVLNMVLSGKRAVACDKPSASYKTVAPRILTQPSYSVSVRIADGCNNRCSYCLIPSIRGPLRSKKPDEILSEIALLVNQGAKEINLIAQDTTAYGCDFEKPFTLYHLIKKILDIKGYFWIRLMYTYPSRISDDLLQLIATEKRVCNYLDMPIQHVNNEILSRMKRNYSYESLKDLYNRIRADFSEIALRTTCMVGFPGESFRHFSQLLSFISEKPFNHLGVFTFSAQDKTEAALYNKPVSGRVSHKRFRLIMEKQKLIAQNLNYKLIGSNLEILVEGRVKGENNWYFGRCQYQAPEVDGKVLFSSTKAVLPGTWLIARIAAVDDYNLIAGEVSLPGSDISG